MLTYMQLKVSKAKRKLTQKQRAQIGGIERVAGYERDRSQAGLPFFVVRLPVLDKLDVND